MESRAKQKRVLTLDYTSGCSLTIGANAMQIGIVAKKVGLSVDAIRFYERSAAERKSVHVN